MHAVETVHCRKLTHLATDVMRVSQNTIRYHHSLKIRYWSEDIKRLSGRRCLMRHDVQRFSLTTVRARDSAIYCRVGHLGVGAGAHEGLQLAVAADGARQSAAQDGAGVVAELSPDGVAAGINALKGRGHEVQRAADRLRRHADQALAQPLHKTCAAGSVSCGGLKISGGQLQGTLLVLCKERQIGASRA